METTETSARPHARLRDHWLFWPVLIVALILIGWALKATASIVLPVTFAFFIAITIAPLDTRVREALPHRLRWVGHAVSMLLLVAVLGVFFAGIGMAARQVLEKFPAQIDQVGEMMSEQNGSEDSGEGGSSGGESGDAATGAAAPGEEGTGAGQAQDSAPTGEAGGSRSGGGVGERFKAYKDEIGSVLRERGAGFAATILNRTASFLASLALVLFLALFMLIEAPRWRQKLDTLMENRTEEEWMTAIDRTAESMRHFLLVKALLGAVTGALYAGWMALMGLDLILVWAVVTFLLNFVPVFGSLVAGLLAAGYAFYQLDFGQALIVGAGLLVIEQVMGNFVEPRFLGRQLSLSSLLVLMSLLLWGWLWGVAGALLATPILILLLMVAAHVRPLRPLAVLLSENGEESVRAIAGPVRNPR